MLRIFTDTAANIPPHLLEQYHITAMPLTYLLDGQPTELVGHDYYEAMRKGAEVKTSLVSPALIRDTMESALTDGDDVLYIAISGGISGTCWSAELMAEELRGEPLPLVIVGDGAVLCEKALTESGLPCRLAPPQLVMQNAMSVALCAEDLARAGKLVSAQELLPVYLRPPQAQRLRQPPQI